LEVWQQRTQRIERNVSFLSYSLLILGASLYLEILQMYSQKKKELYGDDKNEDEDEICLLDLN